jgi:hypothetical protein
MISRGGAALPVRLGALLAVLLSQVGYGRAVPPPAMQPSPACLPRMWSLDFVTVRPGYLPAYLRFVDSNWTRARRTASGMGAITDYRILTSTDPEAAWHVLLMTEYPDSAAYANRESVFQPILRSQGLKLVDGKGHRDLTERTENRLVGQRACPSR